jgi:hypothetical protein
MSAAIRKAPEGARPSRDREFVWMQTISGRAFPLPDFSHADVDLYQDVAEGLARVCRYAGHVPGNGFTVGQHCVVGADAVMEETQDANVAAYFLLHDAHEYIFGDLITPVAKWMSLIEAELYGSNDIVKNIIATAKARLDQSIWRAAGFTPPGATYRAIIDDFDVRMLATEVRHLLMPSPRSWGASIDAAKPIRIRGKISAWPVARVADEFRARLDMYCPNARRL